MAVNRALIHLANLAANIRTVRRIIGTGVKICMAVKADAYGHGSVEIVRAASREGVDCFGVANIQEGAELRRAGIDDEIIVYGPAVPDEYDRLIDNRLNPFVAGAEGIVALDRAARIKGVRLPVHLKIDTGMGRIGCTPEDAPELAALIAESGNLHLAGTCTHFACSDSAEPAFTEGQIERFESALEAIRARGIDPGIRHAANSGAVIGHPRTRYDMVRPGIMLYGYYPSKEQPRKEKLLAVMELRTRITFIKRVPAGTPLSYGSIYRTSTETLVATVPLGYADGLNRRLSNRLEVTCKGKTYSLAGRICMDLSMIDLGPDSDAGLYDEVTLFGPPPAASDAETLADLLDTIPYEITCSVGGRIPRYYCD
ncbi:MAG: alanine racemase [Spirochaetia bacterium]